MLPPALVRSRAMEGTGFLGQAAENVFRLEADDYYLVGTAEVPLAAYRMDETLAVDELPLRYVGFSPCFRREAGTYGKDTKGIIRVHQFDKVEMFTFCAPEDAVAEHQRLLGWERQFLDALEIPYRVIDVASGDLGSSAARKYDCEAWVPTQGKYREVTSTSNCTEFQARRLNIRMRDADGVRSAATLNGTLVAIPAHDRRDPGEPSAGRRFCRRAGRPAPVPRTRRARADCVGPQVSEMLSQRSGVPRMVATDLDGTIVRSDGTISTRTVHALMAAERAGATIVLGHRSPTAMDHDDRGADRSPRHRDLLQRRHRLRPGGGADSRVDPDPRRDRGQGCRHPLDRASRPWVRSRERLRRLPIARVPRRLERRQRGVAGARSRGGDLDTPLPSCWLRIPRSAADELLVIARGLVGDLVEPTHSNGRGLVEMGPLGVTKGTALAHLAAQRGIDREDVVAFGDMPNDLPMLAWAGAGLRDGQRAPRRARGRRAHDGKQRRRRSGVGPRAPVRLANRAR